MYKIDLKVNRKSHARTGDKLRSKANDTMFRPSFENTTVERSIVRPTTAR